MPEITRKPRILHVIDNTEHGGAQTQLAVILDGLRDQFDLSVAVLGRSGPAEDTYRKLGIRIILLGSGGSRWSPGAFPRLLSLIRREKPDLVHTHLFKAMVLTALAARLAGVPCLLHDHSGLDPENLRFYFPQLISRSLYAWAYHRAVRSSSGVLVLTTRVKETYLQNYQLPSEKITVLPNAIDLAGNQPTAVSGSSVREELHLPAETRLIVMVGRLAAEKDWPTFIQVASQFQSQSGLVFLSIGSGNLEGELRKSVADQGLSNFYFLGDRQDVPSILSQADVFLLTSNREAFGIVLLEAMSAGLPVIATRTSGPASIILSEDNGLLVKGGDMEAFVSALQRVLTEPELAARLVKNAYGSLQRYDRKVICQELSGLYASVIRATGSGDHD